MIKFQLRVVVIILCLALQGCSYQAWYTGLQEQQRQQCYQGSMNSAERQQCLDRVNSTTYDQYDLQRKENIQRSSP